MLLVSTYDDFKTNNSAKNYSWDLEDIEIVEDEYHHE